MNISLEVTDLNFKYKEPVLNDINLSIKEDYITAIVGPNGVGKTTLLSLMAGRLKPNSGCITIDGQRVDSVVGKASIAYLPDKDYLGENLSIGEIVQMHTLVYPNFREDYFLEMISNHGVELSQSYNKLSAGQRAKINIALTMSMKAKVYILDEPFKGIDLIAREDIVKTVIKNYGEGSSVVISTHEIVETETLFDEIIFLKSGYVERTENTEDIRENGITLKELYKEVYSNAKLL